MNLTDIRSVYFLGIGGIGMSGLALYLLGRGKRVSGYDRTRTELTRDLESRGIPIRYEEVTADLPQADLVVYTPAIPANSLLYNHFKDSGIPLIKRSVLLGWITRQGKTLAVAGTHGKTSTSTMAAHLLREGGVDCSAFLGGISLNYNSNYLEGGGDWIVAEADEYDRSFLQLYPDVLVLNSLDPDHLDIYGSEERMVETYHQFLGQLNPGGTLISKSELLGRDYAGPHSGCRVLLLDRDIRIENVHVSDARMCFDLSMPDYSWRGLRLSMPGMHNVTNAAFAAVAAVCAGADPVRIPEGLETFRGIHRRFEVHHSSAEAVYVDDYAHHPEELRAAIEAARLFYPGKRVTAVFQPHLFSRTRDFIEGFASVLSMLDEVWIMDIYPARELPIPGVDSDWLFEKIRNPRKRRVSPEQVLELLRENPVEIFMTLGAGDIDLLCMPVKKIFENKYPVK